jgi:hypothetical protein
MVWVGKYEPGGAFQAAALLAAGGIMGCMTGANRLFLGVPGHGSADHGFRRFGRFSVTGCAFLDSKRRVPKVCARSAGWFILVIEVVATVSIALSLVVLFLGSSGYPPSLPGKRTGVR